LVNYCQQYRQHLFVATAQKLSVQQTVQMIQHRAAWVFDKPLRPYLVEPALKSIVESATAVADKLDEFRRLQQLFDRLTEREKQVLDLILSGTPNKDAAEQLEISIRTVEARRAKVYQKTENDNVVGLVRTSQRLEQLRLRFTPLQSDSLNVLHYHLGHAAGQNQSQLENEKNRKNGDDLRYANG
jgi:FixJ family two-component response regulator